MMDRISHTDSHRHTLSLARDGRRARVTTHLSTAFVTIAIVASAWTAWSQETPRNPYILDLEGQDDGDDAALEHQHQHDAAHVYDHAHAHDHDAGHEDAHGHAYGHTHDEVVPTVAAAGTRALLVRVVEPNADAEVPRARVNVRAHVYVPPHDLVTSLSGRTDGDGVARFDVPIIAGGEVVAEVEGASRHFGDPVEIASGDEPLVSTVTLMAATSDPSIVRAARVVTVLQPWESFLVVEQLYTFDVSEPLIYRPEFGEPGPGMSARLVRVDMPEGARAIEVLQPAEQSRVVGRSVFFGAEVAPLRPNDLPHLAVRFSLKHDNERRYEFSQTMSLDADELVVIVMQETGLARHPLLDVRFDAPLCADGAAPGAVCFDGVDENTRGLPIDPSVSARVLRASGVSQGTVYAFTTVGWPSRVPWERWLAKGATLLALLLGIAMFAHERRRAGVRRSDASVTLRALHAQRDALLSAAVGLEASLERGELSQREYEQSMERVREELGVIFRRTRELSSPEGAVDSADEKEATGDA